MRRLLQTLLLGTLPARIFLSALPLYAQESLVPEVASYRIKVWLDTEEQTLAGSETVSFRNPSPVALDTLFWHLYPNAFRDETTYFMQSCPAWLRESIAEKGKWGSMSIHHLGLVAGPDLTESIIIDETVMKLPLLAPLLPGDRISLNVDFTVALPEIIARMGYKGDHYSVGQWFPKLCGLRADGSWVALRYHSNSEFFADFGTYEVTMTVPQEYVVCATGYLQQETANDDGTKTLRHRAEAVHDFYWEADPHFLLTTKTLEDVEVTIASLPAHEHLVPRIQEAAMAALQYYGQAYGSYPYGKLVIVDSELDMGGGGMEYPMIVAIELPWLLPKSVRLAEGIVIHEIGHQWWYGMVATNEFEEAWLDEGVNSYSTGKVLETLYGEKGNWGALFGLSISNLQYNRGMYLSEASRDPIVKNSQDFEDFASYTATVYSKASLMLETMERYLGKETMDQILKTYFERFCFRHPTTRDFTMTAEEISGQDLDWFFEPWLYGTGTCDYAITAIETDPVEKEGDSLVTTDAEMYRARIKVERVGEVVMPVDVRVILENGEAIDSQWDGLERWKVYTFETASKIESAVVDPQGVIVLDVNTNNNAMTAKPQALALFHIGANLLFLWETIIQWLTAW